MTSALAWLGALKRLPRRAWHWSPAGERIPILPGIALTPNRPCRQPRLRVVERERRVEFELQVAGAEAESTRVYWNHEAQSLTVYARPFNREGAATHESDALSGRDWYAEITLPSDLDGARAEAFLKDGTLRIVAPRSDCEPLTGLPLWVRPNAPSSWSLALTT